MDPNTMKLIGAGIAVVFAALTYWGHKSQKHAPKLVAPPKKVEIDPHNIPVVEEPRKWSASNAAVRVGVPITPGGEESAEQAPSN